MRANVIHSRDESFNVKEMFICLECREIGQVLIDNLSVDKVNYTINKEK